MSKKNNTTAVNQHPMDLDWYIALKTGNPVFAWRAVYNLLRKEAVYSLNNRPSIKSEVTIPSDIADFLFLQAYAISELSQGHDPRALDNKKINRTSPKDSLSKMATVLGFSRRGNNAFLNFQSDVQIIQEFLFYEKIKVKNQKKEKLIEIFRKQFGINLSEDDIKKRLNRGKKLLKDWNGLSDFLPKKNKGQT
ncbi:hypothetical protein [Acetobacter sp.]|uniref:hypothetical protein n=1 Tax=Acetobacter sp. TaxID=440 RepID=UPI0039E91D6D